MSKGYQVRASTAKWRHTAIKMNTILQHRNFGVQGPYYILGLILLLYLIH